MKVVRAWGPAVVWMVVIFVLSNRQSISVSEDYWLNYLFFKTLHVIEYAILFIFYIRGLSNFWSNEKVVNKYAIAFLLTILYASSDEIHQLFVSTREGRVRDVIIDTLGAIFAWISITKLLPKSPKKLQRWVKHWLAI
ncbi:MAG: VanZ family protein [Candidatus Gottesmanbacteria bacterium]|nr:VanZ family protein [Candidatus Gottesmanbacteria bacterium]